MYGLYSWGLAEDLFKEPEESWQWRKKSSKKRITIVQHEKRSKNE